MMKSRVPPRGGSAVERGASSLLLMLVALVLLGLAPTAPPTAQDALSLEEAARCGPGPGPVRDMVTWERLCRATMRAASRLPDSDARRLVSLVRPRHLATLHTLTSLWLGPRGKREVVDTKLRDVELEARGPRLSGDVAALEKQLEALEKTPPAGASGELLWREYLEYGKGRLADLRQGKKVKGEALEPPLKWEGYQRMRERFARGVAFERDIAQVVRDDALRPKAQRQMLQDFDEPLVET